VGADTGEESSLRKIQPFVDHIIEVMAAKGFPPNEPEVFDDIVKDAMGLCARVRISNPRIGLSVWVLNGSRVGMGEYGRDGIEFRDEIFIAYRGILMTPVRAFLSKEDVTFLPGDQLPGLIIKRVGEDAAKLIDEILARQKYESPEYYSELITPQQPEPPKMGRRALLALRF
jgi:hypothetical protein